MVNEGGKGQFMRTITIPGRAMRLLALVAGMACASAAGPAGAAPCGGDFARWLDTFAREAAARGISERTIAAALAGVGPDRQVLALDRSQAKTFRKSFEQFAATRVTAGSVRMGASRLKSHAALLGRIEKQYGVPGPVIVAIWGLETGFGANTGNGYAIRALATLAHDCRRTERFQGELLAALQIIDRGDLTPQQMRGAWAGELGQTQFLPSSYVRFAVDYDGNGRRDLIRSVPDVLASTANYLRGYGWQPGGGWQEGSRNFAVLAEWNKSQNYQRTIALFATRIAAAR